MSESGKRNIFGRFFGGGKAPEPAPAAEEKPAPERRL